MKSIPDVTGIRGVEEIRTYMTGMGVIRVIILICKSEYVAGVLARDPRLKGFRLNGWHLEWRSKEDDLK
tara:strand:+ start:106 stop:312 length:207 start_codon:yes stop_codon:yes gene_type:complete